MPWTKRQIIEMAFEEAGLAQYAYDLSPEQLQSAARRLDAMMTSWNGEGVQIGYNASANPDPDEDSGLPDRAYQTAIAGLAISIAPSYGKPVAMETKAAYAQGMSMLKIQSAYPQNVPIPAGYPIGAGYKQIPGWHSDFAPPETPSLSAGSTPLEFEE